MFKIGIAEEYIMGYDHYRIKSNARIFYKNNKGEAIMSVLVQLGTSAAMSSVVTGIRFLLSIFVLPLAMLPFAKVYEKSEAAGAALLTSIMMIITFALIILMMAALIPLSMGYMNWYRRSIYEKVSLVDILEFFRSDRLWSCIGTGLLRGLYVMLWSLLFYIPGIIKTYSYSQTFFIKAENPNISPSRAIELSKIIMDGHKGQLFYLHLSFLGWFILSLFTCNILGILYVIPYYNAALAFAYEEIKADAVARGIIDIREIAPQYEYDMRETLETPSDPEM